MQTLQFSGLTKSYGSTTVLSDVSLSLQPGRIHALMGENGAGKSTFIKLLSGVVPADRMIVSKGTTPIKLTSPTDATKAGFRIIHQELNLVPQLSIAENILLGHPMPQRLGLFIDWRELHARAAAALTQLGISLDVTQQAGTLSPGDRMLVKIASALVTSQEEPPCLYVLDEPTAALSQAEADRLFATLHRLKQNAAILYVSHRLTEVMEICDDVTILRNGRHVHTGLIRETTRDEIILHMTGRALTDTFPPRTTPTGSRVAHAQTDNLNFTLNQGEILGIAGLAGAGQSDILQLFLGLRPYNDTISPAPRNPAEAWAQGIAYVPPERRTQGLALRMGARPNALLPHYKGLTSRLSTERSKTLALAKTVNLKAASTEQSLWQLSGGNQQKVVFARAMAEPPRLLLLDEPTRGVDIGARAEIYRLIRDLSAKGTAVLMASTDLPELLGLCDRILILNQGRQTQILEAKSLTPATLLQACYQEPPL